MQIKYDSIIRNKYHQGFIRPPLIGIVKEVIIHGTAGGGTLGWMRSGGRAEQYYKGIALFHYLIERDGTIWEVIDPERWVYHSCRGGKDRNSIGIEMENTTRDNSGEYNEEQYLSLFWLIFEELMGRFPDIGVLMSHKRAWQKNSNGRYWKECPGTGFDWAKLEAFMNDNSISFAHDPNYESYWNVRKS